MKIHILSNPISVSRYNGHIDDVVVVNSNFIGNLFRKKFKKKAIVASRYKALFIYLFFILLCKFNKQRYFHVYHEGNNYIFDLLWLVFKPTVYRTEYYGLEAMEPVDKSQVINSNYFNLIKILKLTNCFEYFGSTDDVGKPDIYWFRVKDAWVADNIKPEPSHLGACEDEKTALLLVGTDVHQDSELIEVINRIITCLLANSFSISIKDHPNPDFQLLKKDSLISIENINVLNPESLAEDYVNDYYHAIGFGSTGILNFKCPISAYRFLKQSEKVQQKIAHLENTSRALGSIVHFPVNEKELMDYIK